MQPFTEFDYQEFKSKKIEAMPDCQLHPLQRAYMAMRRSAAPRLNMLQSSAQGSAQPVLSQDV
jgi:hypothetical protein